MNLKLSDFGNAETHEIDCLTEFKGTTSYMAPEILRNDVYNGHKVDVFALGVIIFILVVGKMPFKSA